MASQGSPERVSVVAGHRELRCLWPKVLQGFAAGGAYDWTRWDLEEDIRTQTIVVARERNEVVEQEEQEQMKRRARDAKAARVLRMRSTSPSCASPHGQVEGSGGGRGSGDEDGGDEDADD